MCLAVPGRVLETHERDGLRFARVDFGGVRKEICLETAPEARPDDWVLVHVGFALRVLDEAAAREVFAALGRAEAAS